MTATQTPLAIIIEDNVHHGRILQEYLVREGFEVLLCATILEGESVTRAILSKAKAFRPSVVIIDQELVLQGHKDVEGSTLALLLREEIAAGNLHPTHLIAVSADMTALRRQLADQAGCIFKWQKPLRYPQIEALLGSIQQPPIIGESNGTIHALAQNALNLLHSILANADVEVREWTPEEVRWVVGYLSDSFRLSADEWQKAEQLIRSLGGASRAVVRLRNSHPVLTDLRQNILLRLLRKEKKVEIAPSLGIGRTKFENEIGAICELIAGFWSTPLENPPSSA